MFSRYFEVFPTEIRVDKAEQRLKRCGKKFSTKCFVIDLPFTREMGSLWFNEVSLSTFRSTFSCAQLSQRFESSIWKSLKLCVFWYETRLEESLTEICIRDHKNEKNGEKPWTNHRKWVLMCFLLKFFIINTQTCSEISGISELSVRNCMDS